MRLSWLVGHAKSAAATLPVDSPPMHRMPSDSWSEGGSWRHAGSEVVRIGIGGAGRGRAGTASAGREDTCLRPEAREHGVDLCEVTHRLTSGLVSFAFRELTERLEACRSWWRGQVKDEGRHGMHGGRCERQRHVRLTRLV